MPGPAALISFVSGAPQQALPGAAFAHPLVALVTDANGNPVSGVTVTFIPQGQGPFCTFAGGVNTAVTNGSGLATSATITAQGPAGQYTVQAWIGTPGPSAIGPAVFTLMNAVTAGVYLDAAAISAAWTTSKTHQSQLQTDLAAVIADLTNLEADRDLFVSMGAGDVSDWIQQFIQRLRLGYQPRINTSGGSPAQIALVQAPNPNVPRDTTAAAQQLISQLTSGQICGLS